MKKGQRYDENREAKACNVGPGGHFVVVVVVLIVIVIAVLLLSIENKYEEKRLTEG